MTSGAKKNTAGDADSEDHDKYSRRFGVRHIQVLLMFMCIMFGFLMRVNMSVAIISMTDISNTTDNFQTFKWDEKMKNVILSSFFWGYMLLQIPSAYLAHKYGPKLLLFCALFFNGLTTIIIPWGSKIGGWQIVCACRVIQGLTQASLFPSVHTLLSKWIPHRERSRLSNIAFAGTPIGTIVGMPMSSMLAASSYGWPSVFYVIGTLGVLASALWYFCGADSPAKHPTISNDEKIYIENALKGVETKIVLKTPWKPMLTSLPVLALAVAHTGCNWGFLTLLVETPSYLKYALGIDIKSSGFLSALPYLAMWIGSMLLSFVSDYLVNKKILTPTVSRKVFNTIGTWLPGIGLIVLAYIPAGHEIAAVTTITILVGVSSGMNLGFLMTNIDMAPNFAGILISITNCIANCIGILAPITVGFILKDEKDIKEWRAVFFLTATIYFATNLFFIIFGTSHKQPWNEPSEIPACIENGMNEKNSEEMKTMLKK